MLRFFLSLVVTIALSSPGLTAATASPRDLLVRAAFSTPDKTRAIALVGSALQAAQATLAKVPDDREAKLQRGIALGYRGQLTRSMDDARASRDLLAALLRRYPRDAEVQIALGGWHLSVVSDLGGLLGGTMLGASKSTGLQMLDRAVALGGDHAFFPAYAGLLRARLNADNAGVALALLDRAAIAAVSSPVDRVTQAGASRVAALLRKGDAAAAAMLAKQLLPFGMIG